MRNNCFAFERRYLSEPFIESRNISWNMSNSFMNFYVTTIA